MVKIWDESCFAYWEQFNRSLKAFIISLQFPITDAKDRKVFVAEELCDEPQSKFSQENPFADRLP